MAQKYVGKVSMCPSGDYQADTEYKRLDVVNYQGSAYIALADNTNVLPTNATYWMLLVATGNGIASIELIETVGLVNTYRITYTNGDHYDFSITNGATKTSELDNDSNFVSSNEAVLKAGDTMTGGLTMPNSTIGSRKANTIIGTNSLAVGTNITASGANASGFGSGTNATGDDSHAEGYQTSATNNNSHSEGQSSQATGVASHAEGALTTASNFGSHAEGNQTNSSGTGGSHAEGYKTTASGDFGSHAEGEQTTAQGTASHAEGQRTAALSKYQHVQGKFNITDNQNIYAHIVGNGTASNARSNIHTLNWNGEAWYQGDVYVGSTSGTNKDAGSKKLATEEYVNTHGGSIDSISVNGVTQPIDQNKNVNLAVPVITYSTTDLEPGVSQLDTGTFYFVYE